MEAGSTVSGGGFFIAKKHKAAAAAHTAPGPMAKSKLPYLSKTHPAKTGEAMRAQLWERVM